MPAAFKIAAVASSAAFCAVLFLAPTVNAETTYFWSTSQPTFDATGIPTIDIIPTNSSTAAPAEGTVLLGSAVFNNTIMVSGWDLFTTSPERALLQSQPTVAWFMAGFSEGYMLMEQINQTMYATTNTNTYTKGAMAFVNYQANYMLETAFARRDTDLFWAQIHKQMAMLKGIVKGYKARQIETDFPVDHTYEQVLLNNLFPEYDDILAAVQAQNFTGDESFEEMSRKVAAGKSRSVGVVPSDLLERRKNSHLRPIDPENEHCSALIKITDNDVFFGQTTWFRYTYYPGRAYKTYSMETAVSMSGSAGRIHSCDDWYQTSNKLAAMETSNEFTTNDLLFKIHPNSVAEFMRVMAANYLATSGRQWVEYFSTNHSGTYCNQWMVIDYKLYMKGMNASALPNNFFWLAEEIPEYVASADMTQYLRDNTYWGSYNIPYFPKIYAASGFTEQAKLYGTFFVWGESPRAKIFNRDHYKVTDLESMQKMLRYNDWEHDPLSAIPGCDGCVPVNSPSAAISSRFDLTPRNATFGDLSPNFANFFRFGYFGSLDGKITSYDLINNGFAASFQQGPTHDQQAPFEWPEDAPQGKLPGMPQKFDFGWFQFVPQQSLRVPSPHPAESYLSIDVSVYRTAGNFTFDSNGVPVIDVFAGIDGSYNASLAAGMVPLATAAYNVSGLVTGWDMLTVVGSQKLLQAEDAAALLAWYGAGIAEGFATAYAIADLMKGRNFTTYPAADIFVQEHIAYMRNNSLRKFSPFWKQVRKQILQMEGIAFGYNLRHTLDKSSAICPNITFYDVFIHNFRDEYDDVAVATANEADRDRIITERGPDYGDHCSSMVKVTADDVILGQLTWAGFDILIHKQHKTYIMDGTLTLSCNAAHIVSGDDWYETPHGLMVQETTNAFYNKSLYNLIKPQCVSEFMRVMAANYLATSSPEWAQIYSQEPSGTYCNQWMVVDDKLYTKGTNASELPDNFFWLVEELPGIIVKQDTTAALRENGYWASYNIPYFPEIFRISGFEQKFEEDGTYYSWADTPRALIFRRDHAKVTDVDSMMTMLRYNDYLNDELSTIPNCTECSPSRSAGLAISSRFDLVSRDFKGYGYATRFKRGVWGGSDIKIASSSLLRAGYKSFNWAGPTNDQVPTFYWDNNADAPAFGAAGLVSSYNFKPQTIAPAVKVPPPRPPQLAAQYYVYKATAAAAPAGAVVLVPTDSIAQIMGTATSVFATAEFLGDEGLLATIAYNQSSMTQIGWEQVTIAPIQSLFASASNAAKDDPDVDNDLVAWYATGVAEGFASIQSIKNTMKALAVDYSPKAADFVRKHIAYMWTNSLTLGTRSDPYWRQVRKQLLQMEGIAAGFNLRAEEIGDTTRFTFDDIFKLNINTEIGDIEGAVDSNSTFARDVSLDPERCSSLIAVTDEDIYVSHVTWSGYSYLVGRQYKTYMMEVNLSMSANAGVIASGDDYMIASTGLAVQETTLGFFNATLFHYIKPECVSEFMRGMIATYLATTARQWTEIFAREHSGTYCNQWQALDYKLYTKGTHYSQLPNNTLWIIEELPGFYQSADLSFFLREKGFYPSFNIPYFPAIYEMSGFTEKFNTFGSYYSWADSPRHLIFNRDAPKIKNLTDMKRMMRYNNYADDEYSIVPNCPECSPQHTPKIAIAARADLNFANFSGGRWENTSYARSFRPSPSGSCDAKIVSSALLARFHTATEAGPTHDQQPVFSWYTNPTHAYAQLDGMLQTWDFSYEELGPLSTVPPRPEKKDDNKLAIILGAAIGGGVGLIIIAVIVVVVIRKRKGGYDDADDNSYQGPLNEPHQESAN